MGGYGGYVWGSFLLTALVVIWNVLHANRQRAVLQVAVIDLQKIKEAR
ncbi:MAG: heme exporter protein CcmD [Pseudomonadota bacterium]